MKLVKRKKKGGRIKAAIEKYKRNQSHKRVVDRMYAPIDKIRNQW